MNSEYKKIIGKIKKTNLEVPTEIGTRIIRSIQNIETKKTINAQKKRSYRKARIVVLGITLFLFSFVSIKQVNNYLFYAEINNYLTSIFTSSNGLALIDFENEI